MYRLVFIFLQMPIFHNACCLETMNLSLPWTRHLDGQTWWTKCRRLCIARGSPLRVSRWQRLAGITAQQTPLRQLPPTRGLSSWPQGCRSHTSNKGTRRWGQHLGLPLTKMGWLTAIGEGPSCQESNPMLTPRDTFHREIKLPPGGKLITSHPSKGNIRCDLD